MTNEERQRHLQVLPWILERLLERDTRHTEAMVEATRVAFAALEREGQMEARLRWIAENGGIDGFGDGPDKYDCVAEMVDYSPERPVTKDEEFAGFCRMVDIAMEASNG